MSCKMAGAAHRGIRRKNLVSIPLKESNLSIQSKLNESSLIHLSSESNM
jgi:hypothetical protein